MLAICDRVGNCRVAGTHTDTETKTDAGAGIWDQRPEIRDLSFPFMGRAIKTYWQARDNYQIVNADQALERARRRSWNPGNKVHRILIKAHLTSLDLWATKWSLDKRAASEAKTGLMNALM